MSASITQQITDFISTLTPTQWIIAVAVVIMLTKKLIKVAIIIGLIVFVVFPYVKSQGLLDINFDQAGLVQTILKQLGLG